MQSRDNETATSSKETAILEAGGLRLAWGNPSLWKARWREESLQEHLELPVSERLIRAFSLLQRRQGT